MDRIVLCLILVAAVFFIPGALGASANDACFTGLCHSSSGPTIDRTLYDSNPHKIIKCIECHESSIDPVNDSNHGHFIRQLNGSKITGPLTTSYNSQNFSLCYFCHAEKNVVGILPGWIPSSNHVNLPINVSTIGTNFINVDPLGFHGGSQYGSGDDIPTNIHWNHLDAFGSIKVGIIGQFDSSMSGVKDSYVSCPTCHNVHGTNYPKMTKNDLAIQYGVDANGSYGYINSMEYLYPGGDLYCGACHSSGNQTKYYRTEINLFEDCVSCHVDGAPGNVNRTAFSQGVHVNINNSDGNGLVNNSDCWTCHFNRDMNRSNIRLCADCHTGSGLVSAPTAPKIRTHVSGLAITNYSCVDCHSKVINDPGIGIPNITSHYLKRPTVPTVKYCDYCHGPNASSPFPATNKTIPAFNHDDPNWGGNATCRTCHTNSSVSADPLANNTSSFHDLTTELGDVYNGTTKADCVLCHIQKVPQFVAAPSPPHDTSGYTAVDCRGCHTTGAGTDPQKLHSVTAFATGGCIACHSNNATRYYVDTSLFVRHANVNATDGLNNVTDDDCKTCHFGAANGTMKMVLGAANSTNTWFCDACHTSAGSGPIKPTDPNLFKDGLSHGSTNCQWCHIEGASLPRPLDITLRYHPNGPRGTAAGKNCLTCHYYANLPDLPFHAPGEAHESDITQCGYCHDQADNHGVTPLSYNLPPSISGLNVTTPVTSGNPVQIQFTVSSDGMTQIAAAQYQVRNISGIVIDLTNMTGT
ncbi:MAG TPA: cytochrome c3 family protein, partial [Candidatus Methanoperedens sp.]